MHAPMTTRQPMAKSAADLPKLYVTGWLVLALISLAYLVALAARPDLVADYVPLASDSPTQTVAGRTEAGAEALVLRQTVVELRDEIASLKTELFTYKERSAELAARLAMLEPKAPLAASPPAPAAEAPATAPANAIARKFSEAPPTAVDPPKSEAKRVTIAPPAPQAHPAGVAAATPPPPDAAVAGIETGSITAPPPSAVAPVDFGPAIVKPAPKPVGVQIGSGTSVDALRLSWTLLSDRNGDSLRSLQPRYTMTGDLYELVAGPLKSTAEAKRLCKALQAQGVSCKVGPYDGNAL